MLLHDRLTEGLKQIGLPVTARQSEQLETYLGLIQKWNQTYNLVADCRAEPLLIRHLFDCLSAVLSSLFLCARLSLCPFVRPLVCFSCI